jgi:hypothetical protein
MRCGANCFDCTGEMRKIRGYSCRFSEMYHSAEELKQLRKEEVEQTEKGKKHVEKEEKRLKKLYGVTKK